jgi:hypothetical protein
MALPDHSGGLNKRGALARHRFLRDLPGPIPAEREPPSSPPPSEACDPGTTIRR